MAKSLTTLTTLYMYMYIIHTYTCTCVAIFVRLALLVIPEVLVDGLPELLQPKGLLRPRLGVDRVRPLGCVHLYSILIACMPTQVVGGVSMEMKNYHTVVKWKAKY